MMLELVHSGKLGRALTAPTTALVDSLVNPKRRRSVFHDAGLVLALSCLAAGGSGATSVKGLVKDLARDMSLRLLPEKALRFWRRYDVPHWSLPSRYRTPAQWRDISDALRLVYYHHAITSMGETLSFSLRLRDDVETKARLQASPCDWLYRRISYELKAQFGRRVELALALEDDDKRRLHLHGTACVSPSNAKKVRKALRRAGGEWPAARQFQVGSSVSPDCGWATYMTKHHDLMTPRVRNMLEHYGSTLAPTFSGRWFATSLIVKQRAKVIYEDDVEFLKSHSSSKGPKSAPSYVVDPTSSEAAVQHQQCPSSPESQSSMGRFGTASDTQPWSLASCHLGSDGERPVWTSSDQDVRPTEEHRLLCPMLKSSGDCESGEVDRHNVQLKASTWVKSLRRIVKPACRLGALICSGSMSVICVLAPLIPKRHVSRSPQMEKFTALGKSWRKTLRLSSPSGELCRMGVMAQSPHGDDTDERADGEHGEGVGPANQNDCVGHQVDRCQRQQKAETGLDGEHGADEGALREFDGAAGATDDARAHIERHAGVFASPARPLYPWGRASWERLCSQASNHVASPDARRLHRRAPRTRRGGCARRPNGGGRGSRGRRRPRRRRR